jgi:hypothetical protein
MFHMYICHESSEKADTTFNLRLQPNKTRVFCKDFFISSGDFFQYRKEDFLPRLLIIYRLLCGNHLKVHEWYLLVNRMPEEFVIAYC